MPQQAFGPNAKNVVKSVRMTKTQEKLLSSKYGTAQNALKEFVARETRAAETAGAEK